MSQISGTASIYLSRITSSFCLFVLLSEANVWLGTLDNTILVFGYRFFILCTPLIFAIRQHQTTQSAYAVSLLGIFLWFFEYHLLGAVAIAVGLSVSGYMLKYYASHTTQGAAANKMALNIGSVLSGAIVAFTHDKLNLLIVCFTVLLVSMASFEFYYRAARKDEEKLSADKANFSVSVIFSKKGLAWALVGFVIGVKLISIVSILPQFAILSNGGTLPSWFGAMLILNSIIVVVFQLPIMKVIARWSAISGIVPLILGMAIVACSPLLGIEATVGAVVWTVSLSLVECTISYLDKLSRDDGCLLIKEASVGIGSAATVFLVRFCGPGLGSVIVGIFSLVLLVITIGLLHRSHAKSQASLRVLHDG